MLVDGNRVKELLMAHGIRIRGVLHIGAHECEERPFYNNILNISDDNIIWVDGNTSKVKDMTSKGFSNIYTAVLDEVERDVEFNITNNTQASSLLRLNHEQGFYQDIQIINTIKCKTEKLSSFLKRLNKDPANYNFWNLDIQGSELYVLRGSKELLEACDAIYTEVNSEQVYNGAGLISDIDALLREYGFNRVETLWTDMKWGDALYLKTKS
jgi:FkbM family methyltransferase